MGSQISKLAKFFGCGVPKEDQVNDVLTNYVSSDVNYNQELMTRHKSLIDRVIKILEDALQSPSAKQQLQAFRFQRVIKAGSSFENLKVRHPDEFDIMFVFDVNDLRSWTTILMDQEGDNSGYVKFDVVRAMLDSLTTSKFTQVFCNNKFYEDKIFEVLSPTKFYQRIGGFMAKVLRETPMQYSSLPLEVDLHDCFGNGAAVTVTVKDEVTSEEMSLDLVLTLQIQPSDGNKLLVPRKDHWRQSYSLEEKVLMKEIENVNKIFPLVLRIVKAISCKEKATSPLSRIDSYTYKNAMFWLWEKESLNTSLSSLFRAFLYSIRDHFKSGFLPRYFEGNCNLLDKFDKNLLNFLAGYINNIVDNEYFVDFVNLNTVKIDVSTDSIEMGGFASEGEKIQSLDDAQALSIKNHFEKFYNQTTLNLKFTDALVLNAQKVALVFSLDDLAFLRIGLSMSNPGYKPFRIIKGDDSRQNEVHRKYTKNGTQFLDAKKLFDAIMEVGEAFLRSSKNSQMQLVPAIAFEKNPHFILTPAENSDSTFFRQVLEPEIQGKLKSIDFYDDGCRHTVLELLKAVLVVNGRPLLTEEIIQVAVLNNADHFRFSHDKQVTYMVAFILDYIVDCSSRGFMPNPIDSNVNMFANHDTKWLKFINHYLSFLKEEEYSLKGQGDTSTPSEALTISKVGS